MESVWWVFKTLVEKGLVYRGYKVMPFSTACATPLSNFEAGLNYKDVADPAVVVSFPLKDDPEVCMRRGCVLIATLCIAFAILHLVVCTSLLAFCVFCFARANFCRYPVLFLLIWSLGLLSCPVLFTVVQAVSVFCSYLPLFWYFCFVNFTYLP